MSKASHTLKPSAVYQALMAVTLALSAASSQAATIVIVNADAPGLGFNDPTPVTPVGGNAGTTLGAQRMNVYQHVAGIWGRNLTSGPDVQVEASWEALPCTATTAVLGAAGANTIWRDFPNAPRANTWYPGALANRLARVNLDAPEGLAQIVSFFNANLGQATCLAGAPFYLGLDGVVPDGQVNFAEVLLHELGHGLGFQALTSGASGRRIDDGTGPLPSVWERFMYDGTAKSSWLNMGSDAERAASARNSRNLVWTGRNVKEGAEEVLSGGTPMLAVNGPSWANLPSDLQVGLAQFGPALGSPGLRAELASVVDQADGVTGLACAPLSASNAANVQGKLALVDRGTCSFSVKVKNAQDAGALGVLVVDNVLSTPPAGLGGADPTITIPSARISQPDGARLKTALANAGTRVKGRLGINMSLRAGADVEGRVMLYTPNPYQSGSSVSHWDTLASRNLLMEPFISTDLGKQLKPPFDLTLPLLKDIGW